MKFKIKSYFQNLTFKKIIKGVFRLILLAHLILFSVVGLASIFMIWGNPPTSSLMLYRAGFNPLKIKKPTPVYIKQTPSIFIHDLLNAEDGHFREHWGVDIKAIKRARELNKKLGRKAYGGSTITQQLARTMFLIPNKTYFRKYVELLISLEMDLILSKDRILELYLTYAELGKGVYGIKDASHHYYKRAFANISTDQRIRLITILASPIKYSPSTFHKNRLLKKRYNMIYRWH